MGDLYRSPAARDSIQRWCSERLANWRVAHATRLVTTDGGDTHVVEAGAGRAAVVYLPGTNFNAATGRELLGLLAAHCRVFAVDLPGQPGLSSPRRLPETPEHQAHWVAQVLHSLPLVDVDAVVLVGHSRGAHVALCADPTEIDGLVLLNPAGLTKVSAGPAVLRAAVPWVLRPTPARSRALLELMTGGGHEPDPSLVTWLTMVAAQCRTTGAPGPLPRTSSDRWRAGAVITLGGERDRFFPPGRLGPATRSRLDTSLDVIAGVGHLSAHEAPETVARCVLRMLSSSGA